MKRSLMSAALVALLGTAASSAAPLGGSGAEATVGSYGYVVTRIAPAIYKGDDALDCPDGPAYTASEAYLANISAAKRDRLLKPENAEELAETWRREYVSDDQGRNICAHPEDFDRPPQRQVQSKIAYGLDLDGQNGGSPAPNTCAHKNFLGTDGATGVDNQYFRAVGCNPYYRGKGPDGIGDQINGYRRLWSMGPNTTVIMLSGVDDFRNDDHVEFFLASSPDAPPVDPRMKVIDGGSLAITSNPRWRNVGVGRIRDGILTTDPMDFDIYIHWSFVGGEMNLRRARFQLEVLPTGELKGIVAAYWPISNAADRHRGGGRAVGSIANVECAAVYATYKLLADGDPDPKTGQCTSISTTMEVTASPTYLFDDGVMVAGLPKKTIRTAAGNR